MARARGGEVAVFLLLVLLGMGVVTAQQASPEEPASSRFEETLANLPVEARHQVQVEDNLHLIAAYYYGDARQWPRVYTANRALIGRNPSVIHKGQILKIPLPAGWAPLEPYDRFLARVRAAGIPGLTAPPEARGGKPAEEAATPAEAAPAPLPARVAPPAAAEAGPPEAQATEAAPAAPAPPPAPAAPAPPVLEPAPSASEGPPPAPRSY